MSVHPPTALDPTDGDAGTLGALLYADPTRTRLSESDWVVLVRSIAAGDPLALHALFQRSHRIAFTLVMRIVRDRETAEELTLDVFHDVWRRAASYDAADGSVLGWILNQARSRAIDRQRFDHRKKRVDAHPEPPAATNDRADASAILEAAEQAGRLRGALAQLAPDERVAMQSTFFSELTHVEAAERLGQPLGTLKTRIRSGLAKLRAALTQEIGEP